MSNSTMVPTAVGPVFTEDDRIHLGPFVDRYLCDADSRIKDADLAKMAGLASATSLAAQARAAFPRVVIEALELPEDILVLKCEGEGDLPHYIAWDPAQTTRAKVEILINIYIAGPDEYVEYSREAYLALRGLADFRKSDDSPAVIEFWDCVEQTVLAADDPAAAVECISQTITREHAAILAAAKQVSA